MFCKCKNPSPSGTETLWGRTYVRCACGEPIKGSDRYIAAVGNAPKGQRPKAAPVEAKQPKLL